MKYLLFMGFSYYPLGGMKDFMRGFDTLQEAKDYAEVLVDTEAYDWAHVCNSEKLDIIWRNEY